MQLYIDPPNPRQAEFFKAKTRFIAYGGARGGGKSWAVRKKAILLALRYPGIRMLLVRRTYPEVRENHILPLMADLMGIATYKDTDKAFTFPNGSRLRFGYMDAEADALQYQGQEYDVIFMDEATQFSEFQFQTLTACLRGANTNPKRMYLTCNPGGVGHEWVKRLFIDKQYKGSENPADYTFIPAKVYDNTALTKNDTGYINMLENLAEDLRRAWLDGDWDVFAGRFFTEFDRSIHVIQPFHIPAHWRRYRAMDYGLDMLACLWIATDESGRAYVYKELYEPNLIISQAAEKINAMTDEQISATYAPPDLYNRRQDTGKSVADIFAEHGILLSKAKNDRAMGWLDLKEWLHPINGRSRLSIFPNCLNIIRCLPLLQYDKKNPNDVSNEPHELTHAPDALRYFVAGRPMEADTIKEDDEVITFDTQINSFLEFGG